MRKKMKKIMGAILVSTLLATACGCGSKNDDTRVIEDNKDYKAENLLDTVKVDAQEDVPLDEGFINSTINSSFKIYNAVMDKNYKDNENSMLGPGSIGPALGMTANGASAETLAGMEAVICPGMKIEEYNKYISSFRNHLLGAQNEYIKFNMANSIWIRNCEFTKDIKEEFLKTDKKYYNADVYREEFDETTKDKVNNWVKNETNDMIPRIIDTIDYDTVMYLINAMAFEAEWEEQYKDSQVKEHCEFSAADGTKQDMTALYSVEKSYCEIEDAKAVIKNYKGGDFSFVGILPDEGIDIKDFAKSFDGEKYQRLIASKTEQYDVNTLIPEFSFDTKLELKDILSDIGMQAAFVPENADFSKMFDEHGKEVYIGDVSHSTHIEVDRKGTKAAAVTVVEIKADTASIELEEQKNVCLDRPFMFVIMDNSTSIPLFIGVVNTLK